MMHTWRRVFAVLAFALLAASCSDSSIDTVVAVDPGVSVGGLTFTLAGATLTAVSATLPTPDALLAAPVVAVNRAPTATQSATISVSAAEPFTTVLIQPAGSASYLRVFLPAQTTLIGISVVTSPGTSAAATAVNIGVGLGARVSKTSALSLQLAAN